MAYYPLSKITPSLYTSGNEFSSKGTRQDYRGYYFSTYDGKFFTGKTPSDSAIELVKYSSNVKNVPLSALGYTGNMSNTSNTTYYIPTPSEADYTAGYIIRYFIKRVNGDVSTIRELSKEDYTAIQNDPLYVRSSITWLIKGKLEPTYIGSEIVVPGVIEHNFRATRFAEKVMPGLSLYLVNLAQLHK
jgi:hypothetical protein